jgi:Domain of unknown function (DUF6484)
MSLDEATLHGHQEQVGHDPTHAVCPAPVHGVRTGVLIGFREGGVTPLVLFPGQPGTAAIPARSTVDLHGAHIGRSVVLMFDAGDPLRPIVMGCIKGESTALAEQPGRVEVDADGERLVISAREQLVLRCGKASITLTQSGKVLIQGAYVSSRSTGVNRVRGGSVQIN